MVSHTLILLCKDNSTTENVQWTLGEVRAQMRKGPKYRYDIHQQRGKR